MKDVEACNRLEGNNFRCGFEVDQIVNVIVGNDPVISGLLMNPIWSFQTSECVWDWWLTKVSIELEDKKRNEERNTYRNTEPAFFFFSFGHLRQRKHKYRQIGRSHWFFDGPPRLGKTWSWDRRSWSTRQDGGWSEPAESWAFLCLKNHHCKSHTVQSL